MEQHIAYKTEKKSAYGFCTRNALFLNSINKFYFSTPTNKKKDKPFLSSTLHNAMLYSFLFA
jgi:hypothetical protein